MRKLLVLVQIAVLASIALAGEEAAEEKEAIRQRLVEAFDVGTGRLSAQFRLRAAGLHPHVAASRAICARKKGHPLWRGWPYRSACANAGIVVSRCAWARVSQRNALKITCPRLSLVTCRRRRGPS